MKWHSNSRLSSSDIVVKMKISWQKREFFRFKYADQFQSNNFIRLNQHQNHKSIQARKIQHNEVDDELQSELVDSHSSWLQNMTWLMKMVHGLTRKEANYSFIGFIYHPTHSSYDEISCVFLKEHFFWFRRW